MSVLFLNATLFLCQRAFASISFDVIGTISGLEENQMILLQDANTFDGTFRNDTSFVKDGTFQFKGSLTYPQEAKITYANGSEDLIFWLDDGEIRIQGERGNLSSASISGSSIPEQIEAFNMLLAPLKTELKETQDHFDEFNPSSNYDSAELNATQQKFQYLQESIKTEQKNFILQHPEYYFSTIVLWSLRREIDSSELLNFVEVLNPYWSNSFALVQLKKYVNERTKLQVGKPAPELKTQSDADTLIQLSDFSGRYVYIDFWASYCAPCIWQIPAFIDIRGQYSVGGLSIWSVSMDQYPPKWKFAIKRNQIDFINGIVHEQDRIQVDHLYHLEFIPAGVLVSPQGIVLAINPDLKELKSLLKEIFGY